MEKISRGNSSKETIFRQEERAQEDQYETGDQHTPTHPTQKGKRHLQYKERPEQRFHRRLNSFYEDLESGQV